MNERLDGLLDELRFGFVFESRLDLVFEGLARAGAGFGFVCQLVLDPGDAFFRGSERRDLSERGVAGDGRFEGFTTRMSMATSCHLQQFQMIKTGAASDARRGVGAQAGVGRGRGNQAVVVQVRKEPAMGGRIR